LRLVVQYAAENQVCTCQPTHSLERVDPFLSGKTRHLQRLALRLPDKDRQGVWVASPQAAGGVALLGLQYLPNTERARFCCWTARRGVPKYRGGLRKAAPHTLVLIVWSSNRVPAASKTSYVQYPSSPAPVGCEEFQKFARMCSGRSKTQLNLRKALLVGGLFGFACWRTVLFGPTRSVHVATWDTRVVYELTT
jgi:hypothetical protein